MNKKDTPKQRIKALTSVSVAQLNCVVKYLEDVLNLSIYGQGRNFTTEEEFDGYMSYSVKDILHKAQEETKKKGNEK